MNRLSTPFYETSLNAIKLVAKILDYSLSDHPPVSLIICYHAPTCLLRKSPSSAKLFCVVKVLTVLVNGSKAIFKYYSYWFSATLVLITARKNANAKIKFRTIQIKAVLKNHVSYLIKDIFHLVSDPRKTVYNTIR